jgi:hypothetical protein
MTSEYIRLNPHSMGKKQVFRTVLSARVEAAEAGWQWRPQSRGGFAEGLFMA